VEVEEEDPDAEADEIARDAEEQASHDIYVHICIWHDAVPTHPIPTLPVGYTYYGYTYYGYTYYGYTYYGYTYYGYTYCGYTYYGYTYCGRPCMTPCGRRSYSSRGRPVVGP
jgi:hypothetical protein